MRKNISIQVCLYKKSFLVISTKKFLTHLVNFCQHYSLDFIVRRNISMHIDQQQNPEEKGSSSQDCRWRKRQICTYFLPIVQNYRNINKIISIEKSSVWEIVESYDDNCITNCIFSKLTHLELPCSVKTWLSREQ